MTNRVLLNSSGLKVSQPGADVLTAGPSQLLFSSDFSGLALYDTGAYTIPWTTNGNIGWHSTFIEFGKTFATPPSVWFFRVKGSYMVPVGSAYGVVFAIGATSGGDGPYCYVSAVVRTNGIDLRGFYDKVTNGHLQPQITLRYFVFEYNL